MKKYVQFYSQYCITLGLLCVILYIYGFFPVKRSSNVFSSDHDLPMSLENIKFNKEKLYNSSASKTVLMVIDAMRVDFVMSQTMPYTAGIVDSGGGCQVTARVSAPTVTMPRLKAIVTGCVTGYVDVVLNLGTTELTSDNIIQQITRTRRAVFYGDDTWIKMFPRQFVRSEGTSSFFVNDYTEVDNNVTRNLDEEFKRSDWDLMILHYLGVDHIGHIEGPKSSLIQPKLEEMDGIIERIHTYLLKQGSGVLVVCGDHGMKDSGSHGGVSTPEVLVPVLVLGLPCDTRVEEEIRQIDLAPTLSVLWGTPIPADNIGVVRTALLPQLSPARRLYALLHNAQQLSRNFLQNGGRISHEAYRKYEEARRRHHRWLENSSVNPEVVEALYQESLTEMSHFLSELLVNYNIPVLCVALAILFQVVCLSALRLAGDQSSLRPQDLMVTGVTMLVIGLFVVISFPSPLQLVLIVSGLFFTFNCLVLYRQVLNLRTVFKRLLMKQMAWTWNEIIIPIGIAMFCISLFSSSMIEEEHQLWYFLWATVATLRLPESPARWLALLASHRFLRRLNSTGDKWAHLPDISGWLVQPGQRIVLSALCGVSLFCVVMCCVKLDRSRISVPLYIIAAFFVYQHKAAIQHLSSLVSSWESNGVWEARACWWLLLAVLLLRRSLGSLVGCWMLFVCLLLRPYNSLLVPTLFITSQIVSSSSPSNVLPLWMGSVFYFYQGNSNSLASVDLAAGFVGLNGYCVVLVAGLLLVHTYAMPTLAHMFRVYTLVHGNRNWEAKVMDCTEVLIFMQLLHVFVFLVVITLQRYHLFVWTVFSPKLLYLGAQTFTCFILVSTTNICIFYSKYKKRIYHL